MVVAVPDGTDGCSIVKSSGVGGSSGPALAPLSGGAVLVVPQAPSCIHSGPGRNAQNLPRGSEFHSGMMQCYRVIF